MGRRRASVVSSRQSQDPQYGRACARRTATADAPPHSFESAVGVAAVEPGDMCYSRNFLRYQLARSRQAPASSYSEQLSGTGYMSLCYNYLNSPNRQRFGVGWREASVRLITVLASRTRAVFHPCVPQSTAVGEDP